jgi:UDP-N-acetylmuramate dehydrogenase
VYNLRKLAKKINTNIPLKYDESMAVHCSFKVGGPADLYAAPHTPADLTELYSLCIGEGIPFFVLGDGANILISDAGFRGVVIDMKNMQGIHREGFLVSALAGTHLSQVSEEAANWGLAGLESFSSMPGSVGGSIWMNARCYGVSLSEVLEYADIVDEDLKEKRIKISREDFGYKRSPFQAIKGIILRGGFRLSKGNISMLKSTMAACRKDRERKGHFLYPSAGSVFKNNRAFGIPAGRIIDSLGLKGYRIGGAMVSEAHANIIVNMGNATAHDIWKLVKLIKERVKEAFGFVLEEEIIPIGEWAISDKKEAEHVG